MTCSVPLVTISAITMASTQEKITPGEHTEGEQIGGGSTIELALQELESKSDVLFFGRATRLPFGNTARGGLYDTIILPIAPLSAMGIDEMNTFMECLLPSVTADITRSRFDYKSESTHAGSIRIESEEAKRTEIIDLLLIDNNLLRSINLTPQENHIETVTSLRRSLEIVVYPHPIFAQIAGELNNGVDKVHYLRIEHADLVLGWIKNVHIKKAVAGKDPFPPPDTRSRLVRVYDRLFGFGQNE